MEELTPEEQAFLDKDKASSDVEDEQEIEAGEPEEAVEPEPDTPDEPEPKPEKPPEGYVPQGALHAERQKRKEEQAARKALEDRLAKLEARLAEPKEQPVEEDVPDPVMDPAGFREFYKRERAREREEREQQEQARQAQDRQQQMAAYVQRAEQAFVAQTPDYQAAIQHLGQSRRQELTMQGYSPEQVQQIIAQDIGAIAQNALRSGKNPAEIAYELAKHRGYRPAQTGDEDARRIAALATAQRQAGAVSGGGSPANGKLTVKQLADMSPEDMAKLSDREFQEVMGG